MRVPTVLSALLAAVLASAAESTSRTASIYIQPLTTAETEPTPSLLAELAVPDLPSTTETSEETSEVLSYEAPDLDPSTTQLVRIGVYDAASQRWVSSTSVASAENFAKGYAPHFVLSLDAEGNYLGVLCRGVAIDAGQTRDFGPQAVVVRTGLGPQPVLGKPVMMSPDGRKVVAPEEKTFLQKYWWALAIGALTLIANMAGENGTTDPVAVTTPENGAATATDVKGKGKAPATEEPVEDASMAEDDDDDDDEEDEDEAEAANRSAADDDNMEEIDLDNVIGRRTRGKVIDFAKAAAENPADDDEDEDDEDFEVENDKMDED
ncbi:histone chaperone domain CHZ-domain-containing protein [Achaetomium macrosporum]|uniref:Histone chaperone domain CHZ-domain-containing protein n=1 Tax=Achaetomium macrosporum TaxID=79813 RepID=A0AAN7CDZ9_9PEZI|nr:histone chaperone domain CHZ-domain-containing protein [Achaetomium macrosporum]